MPGPRRSEADYLADRIAQFGNLGGEVRLVRVDEFGLEAVIHAVVTFDNERGLMTAFEHLRMDGDRPHRFKYGYRCVRDGSFLFRYDRDPTGHREMPHHKHVAGSERRIECDRVTLDDVAEELWAYLAEDDPSRSS